MAVYTDINEAELAAFLHHYDLGTALSYRGIAEGSENSNYMLHTTEGAYILTLYEKRVDAADLPFFLGLMQHLARKGVECPLPVERRDGAMFGALAGRSAAIITFLEGVWPRRPTTAQCREVGAALAAMHLAGRDFALRRENALSVDGWRDLWAKTRPRAAEFEPGIVAEIDAEFAAFDRGWPADLPAGVIHADLFPDNVFFLGERLSGLIDFYFACNDLFAYDVDLPQRLVLREGPRVQPDQEPRAPVRLRERAAAGSGGARGAAASGPRLGAALHADAAL